MLSHSLKDRYAGTYIHMSIFIYKCIDGSGCGLSARVTMQCLCYYLSYIFLAAAANDLL
jgi:hypothetical protein